MRRLLVLVLVALLGAGAWYWWQLDAARDPSAATENSLVSRLQREAEAQYERGDHDASAETYARGAEAAQAAGDLNLARSLRAQSAVCLKMAGRTREAKELLLPVLEDARQNQDLRTEGLALGNLARVEIIEGRLEAAVARLEELVPVARALNDLRTEVLSLEQIATALLDLGQLSASLDRIAVALERDAGLPEAERRHDALLSVQASVRAALGDDEGAQALWARLPATAATLANRASHLDLLGLHTQAAEIALRAAVAFEAEGPERRNLRDRAILLHAEQLLEMGDLPACAERLQPLLDAGGDDPAVAPFLALRGRLALAEGNPELAIEVLLRAQALVSGTREAGDAALLVAAAQTLGGRANEALLTLEAARPCLAREALRAWAFTIVPSAGPLIAESVRGLRVESYDPADRSWRSLQEAFSMALPRLPWLALEAGLVDAGRLAEKQSPAAAEALLAEAMEQALRWQCIEQRERVLGLGVPPEQLDAEAAQIARWVRGELAPDQAVVALLPGVASSYLLSCRPGHPASSFAAPGLRALVGRGAIVVESLHQPDIQAIAAASREFTAALLPSAARQELLPLPRWTVLMPPELLGVPPALWIAAEDSAQSAPTWLVRSHVVSLQPHALAPRASKASQRAGWTCFARPELDAERVPLAGQAWLEVYGLGIVRSRETGTPPSAVDGPTIMGAEATVAALRGRVPGLAGVRLTLPGAALGRLGGLLFTATGLATESDEAAGLLPFHRLHQLDLPPAVILDGVRFDPRFTEGGAVDVATTVLSRAEDLLLTRWPLSPPMRDAMVARLLAARARGPGLAEALALVQRDYLDAVESAGELAASHPQIWGAWLPFEHN
ncbi:MAG: hypothetical protein ACT4PU_00385 [Planctomycetota bacterium]